MTLSKTQILICQRILHFTHLCLVFSKIISESGTLREKRVSYICEVCKHLFFWLAHGFNSLTQTYNKRPPFI